MIRWQGSIMKDNLADLNTNMIFVHHFVLPYLIVKRYWHSGSDLIINIFINSVYMRIM
jgi:hypothetical protein